MEDDKLSSSSKDYLQPAPTLPGIATGNHDDVLILDVFGHHFSVCRSADGSLRRHNSLRDITSELSRESIGPRQIREIAIPWDTLDAHEDLIFRLLVGLQDLTSLS